MKKLMMAAVVLFMSFCFMSTPLSAYTDPVEFQSVHGNYDVKEDGTVQVTLQYDVYFHEPRHGLEVELYKTYENTLLPDGVTTIDKVVFPIRKLHKLSAQPMDIYEDSKGVVIRMGSPDYTVTGLQHYEFSYEMVMRPVVDAYDIFYMDLIPKTDNPLWDFTFDVTFPKALPQGAPLVNVTGSNAAHPLKEQGTTYSGVFNAGGKSGQEISMFANLGADYYHYPSYDYQLIGYGVLVLVGAFAFLKFMKRTPATPIVDTIEFSAPEGLNSAEVGYVYRNLADSKDIISLIIYWASKGYLTIEELDKSNIQLTKVKDLPRDVSIHELTVFNGLFGKGDVVTTKALENTFYQTVATAQGQISGTFTGDRKLRNGKSIGSAALVWFLFVIASTVAIWSSYYAVNPFGEMMIVMSVVNLIMMSFAGIGFILTSMAYRKSNKRPYFGMMFLSICGGFLVFFAQSNLFYALVFGLVTMIASLATATLPSRTAYGAKVTGEVNGLRKFIQVAEKDRLEMLVAETPYVFYDILPYAYVLGVSDAWSKKFESIATPQPTWYTTRTPMTNFNTYLMWSSLNRNLGRVSSSFTSQPMTSAKSGKSGGGFGGGGGFSGGGFGGGRSGSW